MVVSVVSLVAALFCVFYVMERPGTIAFGSPNPKGEIGVIDAGVVGENKYFSTEVDYP